MKRVSLIALLLVAFFLGSFVNWDGSSQVVAAQPAQNVVAYGVVVDDGQFAAASGTGGAVLEEDVPSPIDLGIIPDDVECYTYCGVILDRGRPVSNVLCHMKGDWTYKGQTQRFEQMVFTNDKGQFNFLMPYDVVGNLSVRKERGSKFFEIKLYSPGKKHGPNGTEYVPDHCKE